MKPRPPPIQIIPAETTHYCKPCFHSIGGVWQETKLWLAKFFVALFEGASEVQQIKRTEGSTPLIALLVVPIIGLWVQVLQG